MKLNGVCLLLVPVTCWSALDHRVDMVLCGLLVGAVVLAVLWGVVSVVVGEVALWWECVKPNPVADRKPRETV